MTERNLKDDAPLNERARGEPSAGPAPPRDRYKRPFDLSILVISHVLAFPLWVALWLVIPLVIWLDDRGPILYKQVRVGKNGKQFKVWKFRTMIVDAEQDTGPVWAKRHDSRVTRAGSVLRRLRLDEMPQVVNIWRGEMSLVGPRPERPELVEQFCEEIPGFALRHRVRPGFAGLAQVKGRYSTSPRDKLRYDNLYIERMGPWLDIRLLFLALLLVLKGSPH
jgi:lipopolysaccharide/colanic/teichoic acid biosynthesis glycosyltransferase